MPAIRGGSRGVIGAIDPPKTYESNSIHHDLVKFGIRIVSLFAVGNSVVHYFVSAVL